MNKCTSSIMGTVKPQRGVNTSWEILVSRQAEYCKLSRSQFPSTMNKNRAGIGVTLYHSAYRCEASLHRDEKGGFYIGSARVRLGPEHTALYDTFLRNSGLRIAGRPVKLEFDGRRVCVS